MLNRSELEILKLMLDDLTKEWTIREVSLALSMPYPQTHRNAANLINKKIISMDKQGKSSILSLSFDTIKREYIIAELERREDIIKKQNSLRILENDLLRLKYSQFICILFGSYADKKATKQSDIDILLVIPEEYSYDKFEKEVKNKILIPKIDIQITTEKGLIEMWSNPKQLNVGNEILSKHVIFSGIEPFFKLRRKYYLGDR